MLRFLRTSSPATATADLGRALALLNGRARGFRTTTLRIVGAPDGASDALSFDHELGFLAGVGGRGDRELEVAIAGRELVDAAYVGMPIHGPGGAVSAVLSHAGDAPAALDPAELETMRWAAGELGRWLEQHGLAILGAETENELLREIDAAVGRALIASGPLRISLGRALEVIVDRLGLLSASIWTAEAGRLELQAHAGAAVQAGALQRSLDALPQRPIAVAQVAGDPSGASAVFPLVVEGEVVGSLELSARRTLSATSMFALGAVATAIAQAVAQRRAADALALRELWLATTLASIGDAVIATDERGRVTFLNAVATALTGWSTAAAHGRPLVEVFPIFNETTGAAVESPVEKVIREGRVVGLANHTVLRHRNGHLTPIEDSAAPIQIPGGRLTGVVLVFRDATALRQAEALRERLYADEQAARRDAEYQRGRLREIIMAAPVAIASWKGPDHVYETANDRALSYLFRADIVGKPLRDALPELPPNHALFRAFDDVYRTGTPFIAPEFRFALLEGGQANERIYSFNLVPTRAADGTIDGLMACAIDVTPEVQSRELAKSERDRAQLALDRSDFLVGVASALGEGLELRTILQRLVETIVPARADFASVWTVHAGGAVRRAVHAAIGALAGVEEPGGHYPPGFPIRQVVDTGASFIIDDVPTWLASNGLTDYATGSSDLGIAFGAYVPIRVGKDIVAVLAVASRANRPFSDGDLQLFTAVANQTALAFENARLYTETVSLRTTAEEASLAKDQFLARVSHDLRNPLGSILGWAGLLKELRNDPVQVSRGVEIIERNAKAQVQLIDDLLDVSRITTGKMRLEIAAQQVQEAIETALDTARLAAEAKRIDLRADIDRDVGSIAVDPDRFRQVIWNLVSNALKFTPEGGAVSVTARREAAQLVITVTDTGRGIAPEFLPHIFSMFAQADEGARRNQGLGLGLTIVRHIVELHGGSVSVASDGLGRGARFSVRFPIRAGIRPSTPPRDAALALSNVRVLVVDDEEDAREIVTTMLEHAGATVLVAGSADEAFDVFSREPSDAVVSDVGMPVRDGRALVQQIRSHPDDDRRRVPVIALTAFARTRDRIDALSMGFDAHLAKPVEAEELVLLLARLLHRDLPA